MPKKAKRCRECQHFASPPGLRCSLSTGLDMKACKQFKEGRPYQAKFKGKRIEEIAGFDPDETSAWSFWISDTQALLLVWDIDRNDYGHFRLFLIGINDDGIVTKKFLSKRAGPAFVGEVTVKGPGENDLWASYGYEDEDVEDVEGNIVNKPREVKIMPSRSHEKDDR